MTQETNAANDRRGSPSSRCAQCKIILPALVQDDVDEANIA